MSATTTLRMILLGEDRGASKAIQDVGKSADKSHEKVALFGSGFGEAGARMSKVMTIAGAAGPALLAAGAALSAAAAGGTAVAAALAPAAAGGIAVYAGALLAVKQGAFALQFALGGLSAAVAGQQGAMKALTPEGQKFARYLKGLKPEVASLREEVQKGLFPGLANATEGLAEAYFPALKVAANQTGIALGGLAASAAKMAESGPWRRDFATVTKANSDNMFMMGKAGLSLADAARSLFVTALPLIRVFLSWSVGAAASIDSMVQAGRASGALQQFWAKAATTGKILGGILGNIGVALGNVFQIGASGVGPQMLRVVEHLTKNFRDWTGSADGARVIAQWFETGRQNLAAMGRLVGAVFGGMQSIGSGSLLAPLIDQVTKKVIPPLMQFLHNASASGALNALVDAVASVVQVFADLSASDSSLKAFAATLKILADSFGWIVQNVPGASQALGAFFVVAGASQALSLVGLGGAVKAIGGAMLTLTERIIGVTAATTGMSVAQRLAALAQIVWTNAVWAFNIAWEANPIGVIVVAVIALIAVFVLAYKRIGWFHAGVDAAFHGIMAVVGAVVGFIKAHWGPMVAILGGPIGLAAVLIIKNFDKIIAAIKVVGTWARWLWNNAFAPALRFIVSGIGALLGVWAKMLGALGSVSVAGHKLFPFADTLSQKLQSAADKANNLANNINKIPTSKTSTVYFNVVTHHGTGGHVVGATGGIVTRPTMALIGEAGPEAVVPLNRTPGSSPIGRGFGGGGDTYNVYVSGLVPADEQAVIRRIHSGLLKAKSQSFGGRPLGLA